MTLHVFSDRVLLADFSIVPARLTIQNGVFSEVEAQTRTEWVSWCQANPDAQIEDLQSALVTPAFVNAHTHLCMLAFRGIGGQAALEGNIVKDLYFKLERNLEPEDVRAFTRLGAVEALMMGTGFVWEHYYFGDMLVEALQDTGLGGAVASTLQDIDGPGKDRTDLAWQETFDLLNNRTAHQNGVVPVLGPHATDTVSDELWTRIASVSEEFNLPIHSHIAQALDEVEWSWEHHNETPVQRMHRLGLTQLNTARLWVHGLFIGDDELQMLNPLLDHLGHCPSAQMQFGFPAHTNSWRSRNFKVLLGTDSGSCNDAINIQSELRFFSSADTYGVTMGESLRKFRQDPTLKRARTVQQERQIMYDMRAPFTANPHLLSSIWNHTGDVHPMAPVGSIETGRWANMVIWDTNHPCFWPNVDTLHTLATANVTPAIQRIMTRGEWRFDGEGYLANRMMNHSVVHEWQQEATERLQHLQRRANLNY